jgi:signal transduction histidine kinase
MKIRQKLLLSILSSMFVILAGLEYVSYQTSRKALITEIRSNATNMIDANAYRLNSTFVAIEGVARGLASTVESVRPKSEAELRAVIVRFLEERPEVYGSTIAFEPGAFGAGKKLVAPYYYRGDAGMVYVDLARSSYDYPAQGWYRTTIDSGKPRWSEPYLDVGGGETSMITYSCPFFRDGKPWGVATVDLALPEIISIVEKIKVAKSGFAFVISPEGKFLSKRKAGWELHRTIMSAADEWGSTELKALAQRMLAGERGIVSMKDVLTGGQAWFAFRPIPATGWSLAIVFPEQELLSELLSVHDRMRWIALAGMAIVFVIVFFLSQRIAAPIARLAGEARRIAAGDFSAPLAPVKSRDEVGVLAHAFGDMRTSLAATLEKLREEKEMFQIAFAQMSDGLVILDQAWEPIEHNHAAERLLGLPAKAPLIDHLQAMFETSIPIEQLAESCAEGCAFKLSRRPSELAGPLHLSCTLTPIFGEDKSVRERILSVRDVTAEESEELAKRNFLSLISHKLFTPLTVLQGMVMLLKDGMLGALSQEQQKDVDSMATQTGKLKGLIEMLVNFVTIEESSLDLSREEIVLRAFLRDLAKKSEAWFPDKHATVEIDVAAELATISFNTKYLSLIVGQLIDNGLKFNMSDPASIKISAARWDGGLQITVTDNGIGIPSEYADRIFDKFFQIEKYFTGNVEGVGLGLAYVKKIVESFGGTIDVRSEPGKGSTFTVLLPKVIV